MEKQEYRNLGKIVEMIKEYNGCSMETVDEIVKSQLEKFLRA